MDYDVLLYRLMDLLECSSAELADDLDVDPAQVSRWLHKTARPSARNAARIRQRLRQARPSQEKVFLHAVRAAPSWMLVTDATFHMIACSIRVVNQFGAKPHEGQNLWGFFGDLADERARFNQAIGMPQGLVAFSRYVIKTQGLPDGFSFAQMDFPWFAASGEVWCVTTADLLADAEAGALKESGWEGVTYIDDLTALTR